MTGHGLRRGVAAAAMLILATVPGSATSELVNTGYFGDVAIRGYDTVAYFTEGRAVEGSATYSHRWLGATWHFASAENRDRFAEDPLRYAPQYGGHCADGVSFGTITTNIYPKAWRIIDGKLYLSYDPGAAEGFEKSANKLADSKKYWPEVQQVLASERTRGAW